MTFQHNPLRQVLLLFIYFTIPFGYGINKYELSCLKKEDDGFSIYFLYFLDIDTDINTTDNAGITENSKYMKFKLSLKGSLDIVFLAQSTPLFSTMISTQDFAEKKLHHRAENHSEIYLHLVTITGNSVNIYPLKKKITTSQCEPMRTIYNGKIKKIKNLIGKNGLKTSGATPARANAYHPPQKSPLIDKFSNLTLSHRQGTGQKIAIDARQNPEHINDTLSLTFFFEQTNDQDDSTACQAGAEKEYFVLSLFVNSPHTAMLGSNDTGSTANISPAQFHNHNSEQKNDWDHTDKSQSLSAFVINQLKSYTRNLYPCPSELFLEMFTRINLLQACYRSVLQASVPRPLSVAPQQRQTAPSPYLPGHPQSVKHPAIQQVTPLTSVLTAPPSQINYYHSPYLANTYSSYFHPPLITVPRPAQNHFCNTRSDRTNKAIAPITYLP